LGGVVGSPPQTTEELRAWIAISIRGRDWELLDAKLALWLLKKYPVS
jgi:hypothetical protein